MENAALSFDKRKHPRIKVQIPVRYKVITQSEEAMALLEQKKGPQAGNSADVSAEGLCLVSNLAMVKGDILKIEVLLPGESQPLRTFSEVMWTHENENQYLSGIFFMALREEDAVKLKRFVDNTLSSESSS